MLCRSLLRRSQDGPKSLPPRFPLYHLLECYQCTMDDEHSSYGEIGMPVPPFGCAFSTAPDVHHMLAVANEEGFVRLYDTESQISHKQVFREWQAHSNAVFDLAWMPREHKIVTASGDQTAKVWDVPTGDILGVCRGHQCSLKSVAFSKFEKDVFCTGGRDGNIMVWDIRCNKKDGFYRQVKQISGAHNLTDKQTPSKLKKKKQTVKGLAPSVDFQQSVTVVLLQNEHTLISAGAVDGVIKIWDLRKNYTTYRQDPVPCRYFSYPGTSSRKLGYSSLILDSTGTSLFANCTDDNIYMFSMSDLKTTPVSVFSGHQNSSFYVKSSISPDDQFLVSGSSDKNAYIWKIAGPQLPPITLVGHLEEVTSVAWCPSDFTKISTCSDDNTIRVWHLRRGTKEENWLDKRIVGSACQKIVREQDGIETPRQTTPAKVLPKGTPPISSPQPAACAPAYTGDLPLPTNTPTSSSCRSLAAVSCTPAKQKEDASLKPVSPSVMSIRQWVTKTPKSSLLVGSKTLSPSETLADISHKLSEVPSPSTSPALRSKMRAKRRLESSQERNVKCLRSCNCVKELHPLSKKIRLEDILTGDSKSSEENLKGCSLPGNLCPLASFPCLPLPLKTSLEKIAGKENGSPGTKTWLSALGDKLRANKSSSNTQVLLNSSTRQQETEAGIALPRPTAGTSVPMRKICTYFEQKSQKN